ncbi:MAG: DUF2911 domain-containing protein [Chitinophagaceae bacterium]
MKRLISLFAFICAYNVLMAQADTTGLPAMDKSPMDMSYYPVDYPVLKIRDKAPLAPVARIIYGRPQKNGRPIFGNLVEYGKVWRLGANEATEIEFYKDVTIDGKKIKKGRYTLYAIPSSASWTLILSKDTDTWGAFKYDSKNDILRTSVAVIPVRDPIETLCIGFRKADTGCKLFIAWDTAEVTLPVIFK